MRIFFVRSFMSAPSLESVFNLPFSAQSFDKWGQMHLVIADFQLSTEEQNVRMFTWGSNQFKASRFYKFIFQLLPKHPTIKSIWKSGVLPKMKAIDWLLFMDRLNTEDMMLRIHWHVEGGSNCVLCASGQLETRDHLFFVALLPSLVGLFWKSSGIYLLLCLIVSWEPLIVSLAHVLLRSCHV